MEPPTDVASDVPSSRELRTAGRAATIMAYAVGLAGVAVGTLALRDDELSTAVLLYVVTFGVGACLIGVATLLRAVGGLSERTTRLEREIAIASRPRGHDGWSDTTR